MGPLGSYHNLEASGLIPNTCQILKKIQNIQNILKLINP